MKLETRVIVDESWIALNLSWLQSALRDPLDDAQKKEFFENARAAFLESAQATADAAFKLGVDFARQNP